MVQIGDTLNFENQQAFVIDLETDNQETFVYIRFKNGAKYILDIPLAERSSTRMVLFEKHRFLQ